MSGAAVITREEDVSEYLIGEFGDQRLLKIGALLYKRICNRLTLCIKQLAGNRAQQMAFNRFINNPYADSTEIEQEIAAQANKNCLNKSHVLCLQDTVTLTYPTQDNKKSTFGSTNNKGIKGFLGHPGLILDASNKDILGLSSIKAWTRDDEAELKPRGQRLIEDKESYRWLETAINAQKNITNAELITIIGDRESDIYELFDRIPNDKTHLLIRSNHNRKLLSGCSLSEHMETIKSCGTYKIRLDKITGVRRAREAIIELKKSKISLKKPEKVKTSTSSIELTCVEAREISSVPKGEEPVFWRILTTHKIDNLRDAQQILTWYTWRWTIEQVFRTMKKKGLQLEESQIESADALLKMFMLSISAAVNIMSLVHARDGATNRNATDIFTEDELIVLNILLVKLEGRTKKQKNSFRKNTLSWCAWIIARLGGWHGYASESPPGPITMYRGLDKFNTCFEFWSLTQQKDVCIG